MQKKFNANLLKK